MHLIIAYACAPQAWGPESLQGLQLPQLERLLKRMRLTQTLHSDDPLCPAMPHERVMAQALGFADPLHGPWAAWQTAAGGEDAARAQAWITPCHWQVGMDQVVMHNPADLQLDDTQSQALLLAMQPYLQADGLHVRWHDALHWHASGPLIEDLRTASADRVIGANVKPWITDGRWPPALRRLQSEMQMLLYTHPVNDARAERGLSPVNSFWVHGAGRCSAARPADAAPSVQALDALREPFLHGDPQRWRQAWLAIDTHLGSLPEPGALSLCGEHVAHTFEAASPSVWQSLRRSLMRHRPLAALDALHSADTL
jgi:hypothetical protein